MASADQLKLFSSGLRGRPIAIGPLGAEAAAPLPKKSKRLKFRRAEF